MARRQSIELDASQLNKALKDFSAFVNADGRDVLLDEARKLFGDGMNFTPPFGRGKPRPGATVGKQRMRGSTKAAQIQGEQAIQGDIKRAMSPFPIQQESGWERRIRESGQLLPGYQALMKRKGIPGRPVNFNRSHHKEHRARFGLRKKQWSGKWLVTKQDQAYLEQYIRQRKRGVGTLKAGYGIMVVALNAQAAGRGLPQSRIPGWVGKRVGAAGWLVSGKVIDLRNKNTATIAARVMSHRSFSWSWNRALSARTRSLERNIRQIVQGNADKVNGAFKGRFR